METVGDILDEVSPYAGPSGSCTEKEVIDYINGARKLLWNKTDAQGIMDYICICCVGDCFTLPSAYKQIRLAWMNGTPLMLGNEWYQSVPRNGGLHRRNSCHRLLTETGGRHVTFRDSSFENFVVQLQPESQLDTGAEITVYEIDRYGTRTKEKIVLGTSPATVIGRNTVKAVIGIAKGKTAGRIRLYALNPNTSQRELLAVYQPYDINPQFRRYRLSGRKCDELTLYVKKKWIPVESLDDFVEFNTNALIHAMQALVYRESRDDQKYLSSLALAVAELNREEADDEQMVGSPMRVFVPDRVESLIPTIGATEGTGRFWL